jgi:hypothetical protein
LKAANPLQDIVEQTGNAGDLEAVEPMLLAKTLHLLTDTGKVDRIGQTQRQLLRGWLRGPVGGNDPKLRGVVTQSYSSSLS